jgi:fructokinase
MEERWGQRAETLPADHAAWTLEAKYLGLGLVGFICTLSPQRVIMGGGVMEQPQLLPLVREQVQKALNKYLQTPEITERIDQYIVAPGLENRAGIAGALALAMDASG